MNTGSLKRLSLFMTTCALIMIFAHIVIPHSHDLCYENHNDITDSCCATNTFETLETNSHSNSNHHHCNVTNIIYHSDSHKGFDEDLLLLFTGLFDFIYAQEDLLCVEVNKKFISRSENVIPIFILFELPMRAPPIFA